MASIEERIQKCFTQITNNQVEEGYQDLLKIYKETKDLRALYYITLVEYDYKGRDINKTLSNFEYIIKKGNDQIRQNVYIPYILMCIDYELYEKLYKMSEKAMKDGLEKFFVFYGYAQGLFYYKNDVSDNVVFYVNKALECEDVDDDGKLVVYILLMKLYLKNKHYEKCEEVLNRVTFIDTNGMTAHFLSFLYQLEKEGTVEKEILDLVLSEPLSNLSYDKLVEYYYDNKEYEKTYEYACKWRDAGNDSPYVYKYISFALVELDRVDEAIETIKEHMDLENSGFANFLLANTYFYVKGYKCDAEEALKYYQKAYELDKSLDALIQIGKCYVNMDETDKVYKTIIDCVKLNKKVNDDILKLSTDYSFMVLNFKSANKFLKKFSKSNKNTYIWRSSYLRCNNNYKKILPSLKKDIESGVNKIAAFNAYFNGAYGYKIDLTKAQELVDEIIKDNDTSNCYDSIVGLFYLESDKEKAIEYFSRGACRFLDHKEPCTCSIGLLAQCFIRGIGVSQDVEKGYAIAEDAIAQEGNTVNTSVANAYAEGAILLGKDLNKPYDILLNSWDKLGDLSRLFMIIKVGKLLNKDVKKYEKDFKKAYKYASLREKEYYSKEVELPMLINE